VGTPNCFTVSFRHSIIFITAALQAYGALDSVSVKDPVCGTIVDPQKTLFKAQFLGNQYYFDSEYCLKRFVESERVAYFSMEIGINKDMSTYSGGLGILAGDVIRSSADLHLPMIAVTLACTKGYLKQKMTPDGWQMETPDEWNPDDFMKKLPQTTSVRISGHNVKVGAWVYEQVSFTGYIIPVLFLTTDVEENQSDDRQITSTLYGGDELYRLKQEIILGIGGVRLLNAVGVPIKKYHMNEGHSSLLTLELLKNSGLSADKVRNICVFTTHTPVAAAFDKFPYDLVARTLDTEVSPEILMKYGGEEKLNMTMLALNLSKYTNGVTEAHMQFSRKLFPGYHIQEITNGVHSYTWTSPRFRKLYDKYLPRWANEPELLVRVDSIPEQELWEAHMGAKADLIDYVFSQSKVMLDIDALTLGFARRATEYKRATMLFSDLERLTQVTNKGKLQLIFAGKAHPKDVGGKELIKDIYRYIEDLKGKIKIVYLENYDMAMAQKLTSGVDVWLNTPLPPYEASGTSGMKAAHNGVINFSVLDGWWIEGCVEGLTGWAIGPSPKNIISEADRRKRELADLYGKLEFMIMPKFYGEEDNWIWLMRNSIGKVAYYFNTHRMMKSYATDAYL
jgi:glycogen phosphorylase